MHIDTHTHNIEYARSQRERERKREAGMEHLKRIFSGEYIAVKTATTGFN